MTFKNDPTKVSHTSNSDYCGMRFWLAWLQLMVRCAFPSPFSLPLPSPPLSYFALPSLFFHFFLTLILTVESRASYTSVLPGSYIPNPLSILSRISLSFPAKIWTHSAPSPMRHWSVPEFTLYPWQAFHLRSWLSTPLTSSGDHRTVPPGLILCIFITNEI